MTNKLKLIFNETEIKQAHSTLTYAIDKYLKDAYPDECFNKTTTSSTRCIVNGAYFYTISCSKLFSGVIVVDKDNVINQIIISTYIHSPITDSDQKNISEILEKYIDKEIVINYFYNPYEIK